MKLFGGTSGARTQRGRTNRTKAPKKRNPLKIVAILLALILFVECCYFFVVFTDNKTISQLRTIYIETAMDTLNHKWLATAIFPSDLIDEVMLNRANSLAAMEGLESQWGKPEEEEVPEEQPAEEELPEQDEPVTDEIDMTVIPEEDPEEVAREAFFELYYEIDRASMEQYVAAHPEVLANGWDNIYINEAGQDYKGIDVYTIHDEQVLAIDVPNKLLLVKVEGGGLDFYQGVLAICKDNSQLRLEISSQLGIAGEYCGTIAEKNNGVIAISASGYDDPDGNGNGGIVAGYTMSNGVVENAYHMGWGFKRLELREDNLMYIKDASSEVGAGTTDAMEFQPALILDGEIVVDANCGWTGLHPRSCIGQSDKYEILMLVIEGRMPTRSVGTHVIECAEILKRHGCMQAMNVDGGTSAIMWYNGENITKCNNAALPSGRPMPNAWVYGYAE